TRAALGATHSVKKVDNTPRIVASTIFNAPNCICGSQGAERYCGRTLSGDGFARRGLFRFSYREFESDFAVLELQVRREWPAFLRNKLRQKVRFAGRDQFLHLLL